VELEIAQTDVLRGRESGSEIVIRDPRQPLGRMDAKRLARALRSGPTAPTESRACVAVGREVTVSNIVEVGV